MEINRFYAHVQELAAEHRVIVIVDSQLPPEGAVSISALRTIVVHPIFDELTYMIALHEMGHSVAKGGYGQIDKTQSYVKQVFALMDQEDVAWAWAREHAMLWTDLMEHWAEWAREEYRQAVVETVKASIPKVLPKIDDLWKR